MEKKFEAIEYHDRVYGTVIITAPVIVELMQSAPLRRLEKIDQSGHFEPFYPGTFQSRFEHSIGVYLLLKKFGAPLEEQIAGLVRDVSHSAFSHCIDYVIEGASPEEQNHQDSIFEKFIRKTEIPKILKKHGFNINYILNDANFPLKENNLPDLCADRIDYSLRTALVFKEINDAGIFLRNLRAKDNKWFFADKKAAKDFARLFLKLNSKYYAGLLSAVMFKSVGDYLRYSLGRGYIKSRDLYTTDEEVLGKIARYHKSDRHLRKLLSRMDNNAAFSNNAADHDAKIICKSRVVDPLFKSGKKLLRLSQVDAGWSQTLKKESKPKTYYIKFGNRWRLPAKVHMKKNPFAWLFVIVAVVIVAVLVAARPGSWNGPEHGVVLDGDVVVPSDNGSKIPARAACGIENCHGLDIPCGSAVPEVCTEIYMAGDSCRQFAKCAVVEGQCQFAPDPKFMMCKTCVAKCVSDFKSDPAGLFECEGNCSQIESAQAASPDVAEIPRRRNIIESLYPSLKDFENQESFAGQRVKAAIDGTDYYFAYITEGSGVPIVEARCFRVDADYKIYPIGDFKDSSIAGDENYMDIDPVACKGLK